MKQDTHTFEPFAISWDVLEMISLQYDFFYSLFCVVAAAGVDYG